MSISRRIYHKGSFVPIIWIFLKYKMLVHHGILTFVMFGKITHSTVDRSLYRDRAKRINRDDLSKAHQWILFNYESTRSYVE